MKIQTVQKPAFLFDKGLTSWFNEWAKQVPCADLKMFIFTGRIILIFNNFDNKSVLSSMNSSFSKCFS